MPQQRGISVDIFVRWQPQIETKDPFRQKKALLLPTSSKMTTVRPARVPNKENKNNERPVNPLDSRLNQNMRSGDTTERVCISMP